MAVTQRYGIKYPFTSDNEDGYFIDLNTTYEESIKSQVLHVIFTPKGQRVRNPEFGTNLIRFIFSPNDSFTLSEIKSEITTQVNKYVPSVEFRDITIYADENQPDNGRIVMVEYAINKGNISDITTVAVKV